MPTRSRTGKIAANFIFSADFMLTVNKNHAHVLVDDYKTIVDQKTVAIYESDPAPTVESCFPF